MKNRDIYWRRYKKRLTQDNDASVTFKVGTLGLHTVLQLPSAAPWYFPKSHQWSEISSLSKVILVWGEARSHRVPNLGCRGAESPGWFDISPKISGQDMMHEQVGTLLWWSCQSSVAHSCSLLNHLNSFHGGMFKLNTKFNADLLLYSLSRFECEGQTVHMLSQWHLPPPLTRTVKSSLFTHAHSSPLSLDAKLHRCYKPPHYINNGWTFSGKNSYMCV